ncbi:trigger factor [Paenibacillus sp. y28]|uniref:trigger factor n=1 Tax=Paenibacillus sp. y28 TaxID=3129110 RepID=UPI003017F5CD
MKATWEKIENNQAVLTVEVGAEKVNTALDKAFKKVSQKATVPGFRKGKVPRPIFERKYGIESLYQDAIDILLPEVYSEAVKETGIEPVDRPDIEIDQFSKGEAFKFKATVTVKPEVELGEYKGLEVEEASAEVTDEEVQAELNRLQQRHAELVVIEDRAAQLGDVTVIDFEGFLDGVAFEGGKGENHSLELGSGSFIPGFEDQVVGMSIAEEKEIQVTFPEDYQAENLKGKEVTFKVKVNSIKAKNLPELDDEFAKDASEFDTLDEFKQDITSKLKNRKEQEAKGAKEAAVVDKAVANAKVDVPQAMIETEIGYMVRDFSNRLRMQGMTLEMYYQFTGQSEAQLRDQMKGDAEVRVRNNLVLEAIAKAEGITASDEDLTAELEKLAAQYQRSAEELRSIFTANGNIEDLRQELTVRKTVDYLVEQSKVVSAA